jgi:hypothetical protein
LQSLSTIGSNNALLAPAAGAGCWLDSPFFCLRSDWSRSSLRNTKGEAEQNPVESVVWKEMPEPVSKHAVV